MKGLQNFVYLVVAAGMLVYAVPQLKVGQGFKLETIFATVWLGLALLVIAAHLYVLLKVDQEVEAKVNHRKALSNSDH
ncbi:MAG: hypothetical protein WD469_10510 [Paenibacillaceae bacterium]